MANIFYCFLNCFPFDCFTSILLLINSVFFSTLTVNDFKDLLRPLCMHFSSPKTHSKKRNKIENRKKCRRNGTIIKAKSKKQQQQRQQRRLLELSMDELKPALGCNSPPLSHLPHLSLLAANVVVAVVACVVRLFLCLSVFV